MAAECNKFFTTTAGSPIRTAFDALNKEVQKRGLTLPDGQPVKVSGTLLRKASETASHGPGVVTQVAARLQRSTDTVRRHYVVDNADVARRR